MENKQEKIAYILYAVLFTSIGMNIGLWIGYESCDDDWTRWAIHNKYAHYSETTAEFILDSRFNFDGKLINP